MADTAQFKSFGPFYRNGSLVTAPRLYHYAAGTTTLKNAWIDRDKEDTAAQPILGDANGVVSGYFDGVYKIKILLADNATELFTWDDYDITEGIHRLQASELLDEIELDDATAYMSPTISVPGAEFGNKVLVEPLAGTDMQGILCNGFVISENSICFNLYNVSGGTRTFSEGSWSILVLQA